MSKGKLNENINKYKEALKIYKIKDYCQKEKKKANKIGENIPFIIRIKIFKKIVLDC